MKSFNDLNVKMDICNFLTKTTQVHPKTCDCNLTEVKKVVNNNGEQLLCMRRNLLIDKATKKVKEKILWSHAHYRMHDQLLMLQIAK